MGVCSFVCCNGVRKSGLSSIEKLESSETFLRTIWNLMQLFLVEFLRILLCKLRYKWPNWTDLQRVTHLNNGRTNIWTSEIWKAYWDAQSMRSFIGAQTRSKRKSLWLDNLNISWEKLMTDDNLSVFLETNLHYSITTFFWRGSECKDFFASWKVN